MKKRLSTFVLACFLLFVTGCSGNAVDEQEILSEESDVAETETTATSGSETGSELSSTETTASAKKDISNSEACLILDDAVDSIGDTADAVIDALEYWNDNDFSTYDDILDYQLMWTEIVADIYQIADEFDAVQPSSGYQYLWSHIGDEIRNAGDALYPCTHLDEDSDGMTTGSEAKRQLQEGTSEYTTYMTTVIEDIDVLKTSLSKNDQSSSNSSDSSTYTTFTNKYGTPTTICAHTGCTNYIANSGDTNCCTTHSNKCAECGCYIDEDAIFCIDCLAKALD